MANLTNMQYNMMCTYMESDDYFLVYTFVKSGNLNKYGVKMSKIQDFFFRTLFVKSSPCFT